jgi:hypothetical protein
MFSHHVGKTLFILLLFFLPHAATTAQTLPSGDLAKKRLPATILGRRTLIVPDPFNGNAALRRLFPGKWYDLSTGPRDVNRLISWVCPTCKTVPFTDANSLEDPARFPFPGGVATRLINVFSYADSTGKQHKLMSFNHSDYDRDGLQTGRFTGGLLAWQDSSGWIVAGNWMSFNRPSVLMALFRNPLFRNPCWSGIINMPIWSNIGQCTWTCSYRVAPGEKHYFRDIIFVCKGRYFAADKRKIVSQAKEKTPKY